MILMQILQLQKILESAISLIDEFLFKIEYPFLNILYYTYNHSHPDLNHLSDTCNSIHKKYISENNRSNYLQNHNHHLSVLIGQVCGGICPGQ